MPPPVCCACASLLRTETLSVALYSLRSRDILEIGLEFEEASMGSQEREDMHEGKGKSAPKPDPAKAADERIRVAREKEDEHLRVARMKEDTLARAMREQDD